MCQAQTNSAMMLGDGIQGPTIRVLTTTDPIIVVLGMALAEILEI